LQLLALYQAIHFGAIYKKLILLTKRFNSSFSFSFGTWSFPLTRTLSRNGFFQSQFLLVYKILFMQRLFMQKQHNLNKRFAIFSKYIYKLCIWKAI